MTMRAVDLDFLDTAPLEWTFEERVAAPQKDVFAAVSGDPNEWGRWFPGVAAGGYEGEPPYGVGTKRWVRVAGMTYRETMLAWDEPSRWVFRLDHMPPPIAHAAIEEYTVESAGPDASSLRWTFAADPRPLLTLSGALGRRTFAAAFGRAARNLERLLQTQ